MWPNHRVSAILKRLENFSHLKTRKRLTLGIRKRTQILSKSFLVVFYGFNCYQITKPSFVKFIILISESMNNRIIKSNLTKNFKTIKINLNSCALLRFVLDCEILRSSEKTRSVFFYTLFLLSSLFTSTCFNLAQASSVWPSFSSYPWKRQHTLRKMLQYSIANE